MGNVLDANVPPTYPTYIPLAFSGGFQEGNMMLWKLTRVMKAAGWIYKSSGVGITGSTLGKNTPVSTAITAGSNGASLPQATINATNPIAAGFTTSGSILIITSAGLQTVTYTGITTTTFTGCSGGTGTMTTGNLVMSATVNPNNDLWNGYGAQISGQSGSAASYASGSVNTFTISGLTGMSANSVGRILIISNANSGTNNGNNGAFRIIAFNSSTSVTIYNSRGSSPDGLNGFLNWQEMDSAAYVPGQTGGTASITTLTSGRVLTLTGLTGMTPLSTNRYLTITGASSSANNGTFKILSYISATSVTIINIAGVASDVNNGSITWREMDPLLETYTTLQVNTWLCMQGPSTLKVPITSASTGTFLKGENITQTTTGAQGEVIGYVFDTVAAAGFLVVMPRVNGTGSGPLGWGTNLITGNTSGTTVTPSANPIEYVREAVFYLPISTPNRMKMWMQCIDNTNENTSRFSVLSGFSGTTAVIPPGAVPGTGTTTIAAGSNGVSLPQTTINVAAASANFPTSGTILVVTSTGTQIVTYSGTTTTTFTGCSGGTGTMTTGNGVTAFPVFGTMVVMGENTTSTLTANSNNWGAVTLSAANGGMFGYSHFMCADATYDTGRSADGSFCGAVSVRFNAFVSGTANINGSYIGCLWTRCDAQEDGDIDPYVFYMPGSTGVYSATRTGIITQHSDVEQFTAAPAAALESGGATSPWNNHLCRGWRRRGFTSGDAYQNFGLFTVGYAATGLSFIGSATGVLSSITEDAVSGYSGQVNIMNRNISAMGEPIWVISANTSQKMRKGIMRWARLVNTGTATNLYNGGLYIQLSDSFPAFIVGPWDKRTNPVRY